MITFDTKDLDRVEKSLLRLSRVSSDPKLISKVIRKPMRDASKPILAAIKADTNVKTGALLAAAKITIGKAKKGEEEHFRPNTVLVSRIGYFWRGAGGMVGRKARGQEYGSAINPPRAVLRKALESGFDNFVNTFRRGFVVNVEKAVAKEFKRSGLKVK